MNRFNLLIAALFLIAVPIFAQSEPTVSVHMTDGVRKWYEPLPVPHRTADKAFWASTIVSGALTVVDVENSVHALKSLNAREVNGVYGSHPDRLRYYSISLPVFAVNAYMGYRYKREDDALNAAGLRGHKYVKWWLPNALNGGAHAFGTLFTVSSTGK